jgi:DNA-binding GntR family transcriptional regulator
MQEADDIYDVRASLDETIGRRVAAIATPEQVAHLRTLVARMERAVAAGETGDYFAANIAFHDSLAQFTANAKLLDIYRKLVNELSLYRRTTIERGGATLPAAVAEHRKIVEAIAARDTISAGCLMFEHAMASRDRMHAGLGKAKAGRRVAESIK